MAYTNNNGQVRIGVRAPGVATVVTASTLLTSLYSVWNGDTLGTSLDSSIFGAWNGEISSSVTTLNTSLVSSWNANGNTTDSVGANNGTVVGGLTYSTGKIGNAFTFNGNSYVQLPNNSLNVTANESFSLSSWIYVTSASTYQSIVSSDEWPNTGTMYGWGLRLSPYNSTKMNVEFYTDWQAGTANPDFLQASNSISLNTWIHVLATRNGSTGVEKIYINGSQVATRTKSVSFISSPRTITPSIGADKYNSTSVGSYISNGSKIDSVSFWRKELSISEVSALYNSGNSIESPYPASINTYIQSPNDSFGTNHGTLVNGTTFTNGKLGSAFLFDGINDYVTLPSSSLRLTDNFTISLWVYYNSLGAGSSLVENYYEPTSMNRWGFALYQQQISGSSRLRFATYAGNTNISEGSTVLTTGTWYHIVVTKSSNNSPKMYVNGLLETFNSQSGNTSINPSYQSQNFPTLGVEYGVGSYYGYLNGRMDSITTWTKALTSDEVTQLYNSGTGAQYPFSSQTLSSAGNQLGVDNGTLMNGCSLTTGKIGQAFTFDGVNDYVALPDNSLNFTGDFSVSAWIYVSNLSGEKYIISNGNGNAFDVNTGWSFGIFNNKISFWVYTGGLSYTGWLTNTTLSVNTWHHVSVTKKTSQSPLLYIDGVLSSNSLWNNTMANSLNPVYTASTYLNTKSSIGVFRYNNGSSAYAYWNGKIDALNVWQKELTQSEITELYNSGNGKQLTIDTKIVTSGLVLNLDASRKSSYPNTGTTWFDISGNGYNGTMVNGVTYSTTSSGVMNFDGINDYVSVSNFSTLTSYTIESWFKINYSSSATYARIIEKGLNNEFTLCINKGWAPASNKYTFQLFDSSVAVQSTSNVDSTRYNHVCISVERTSGTTNVCKIYVNGVLENTSSISGSITSNTNPIYIGNNAGAINSCGFLGEIPSIRMYNRALTSTEITQNFNVTKSRFGL